MFQLLQILLAPSFCWAKKMFLNLLNILKPEENLPYLQPILFQNKIVMVLVKYCYEGYSFTLEIQLPI